MRKPYPTDLSDSEWKYIEPHVPTPKAHGRPRVHSPREILDAVFYVLKSGCQWRLLPHDFPRWPTVYHYFRTWRIDGTWEKINRAIRQRMRVRLKRHPQPSAGIVDSQSLKTTGVGGEDRGYDGGKKIKGCKRHLLVDAERLFGNSDRSPIGAVQPGNKRPRTAIFGPCVPSMTAVEKPSDYFPYSLRETV